MRIDPLTGLWLALPAAVLAASAWVAPYVFEAEIHEADLQPLAAEPVRLFRKQRLLASYTSEDLLKPGSIVRDGGQAALVFDVPARGEGEALPLHRLTWVRQIAWALELRGADGRPIDGAQPTDADRQLATRFLAGFTGEAMLERGAVQRFDVPAGSSFRARTGIAAIVAIAIKDPGGERIQPGLRGTRPMAIEGLAEAARQAAGMRVEALGIPYMPVPRGIGQEAPPAESWKALLDAADGIDGVRRVTFGGFGLIADNRERTDGAFRQAWKQWQRTLVPLTSQPAQEKIRLSALVAAGALAGAASRRRRISARQGLAALAVAAGLAVALSEFLGLVVPLMPALQGSPAVLLAVKALAAVAIGWAVPWILRFDARSELLAREPEPKADP